MKRALIPAVLLSLCIFSACSLVTPKEGVHGGQPMVEAAFSDPFGSGKAKKDNDATAFLVGAYDVSNNYAAYFDGRGRVTLVAPDGSSTGGSYAMEESDNKIATVRIDMGQGETEYNYRLNSSDGDFTLTGKKDEALVFVLKTFE